MRVGLGYDVHVFADGRALFLGGLQIPHEKGLQGHSDGDVLLHAIADAVLGAAGLPDIGFYFPDTDKSIEGIESARILARAVKLVRDEGFDVANIDAVIVCQEPRIMPYREEIRRSIAKIVAVDTASINVKGKTTEGLGLTGRREGIESHAVCLLKERS